MLNFWNMYNKMYMDYNCNHNNMFVIPMPFKQFNWYNTGYIPMNFTTPSSYPTTFPMYPMFNFFPMGAAGGSSAGGASNGNVELTEKQKAQIEEIRQMKYDSDNLNSKLDENKNINTYAKYLEGNSAYHVADTIETEDGGKIYRYKDSNEKFIGSINKDSNGKIRNVALGIADGGEVSLSDHKGNDGIIDSQIAISKSTSGDKNIGVKYEKAFSVILDKTKDYEVKKDNLDNGRTCSHYYSKNGKEIAFVIRDKAGIIVSIKDMSQDGDIQFTYTDNNRDGKISEGEEIISYSRDLSDK